MDPSASNLSFFPDNPRFILPPPKVFPLALSSAMSSPVWVLSTTSAGAPSQVFAASLLCTEPMILVLYTADKSFEVLPSMERVRPRHEDQPPSTLGRCAVEGHSGKLL